MVYNYLPIGHSDLRLLASVSIQSDRLSFSMTCFAQKSAPRYTAISFTWGNETSSEYIFINGQPFPVRLNLWSCLHSLAQDKTAGWTHLWVDAICIDQKNNEERTAQVRRMDTYIATRVPCLFGLVSHHLWSNIDLGTNQYELLRTRASISTMRCPI